MYKVIRAFKDAKDKGYSYSVGDDYPRKDFKVSEDRLKELSSDKNKQKTPLIKKVAGEAKPKIEQPKKATKKKKANK